MGVGAVVQLGSMGVGRVVGTGQGYSSSQTHNGYNMSSNTAWTHVSQPTRMRQQLWHRPHQRLEERAQEDNKSYWESKTSSLTHRHHSHNDLKAPGNGNGTRHRSYTGNGGCRSPIIIVVSNQYRRLHWHREPSNCRRPHCVSGNGRRTQVDESIKDVIIATLLCICIVINKTCTRAHSLPVRARKVGCVRHRWSRGIFKRLISVNIHRERGDGESRVRKFDRVDRRIKLTRPMLLLVCTAYVIEIVQTLGAPNIYGSEGAKCNKPKSRGQRRRHRRDFTIVTANMNSGNTILPCLAATCAD